MILKIEITNWAKYNPRTDKANYSWFRFQNDFFHDQNLFGLADSQLILFLTIICLASSKSSGECEANIDYLATMRKCSHSKILSEIRALEQRGVIRTSECRQVDVQETSRERPRDVQETSKGCPRARATNERTNVRDERTNDIAQPAVERAIDLDSIYEKYPRKVGKGRGLAKLKTQIKGPADFVELSTALDRFISHHKAKGTESDFIPHFSTWVTNWRDWLDPSAGTSEDFSEKPISIHDLELPELGQGA